MAMPMDAPTGGFQPPDVIERGRLVRQLDAVRGRRLALIVAQAAQGKTTLAASYLSACRTPGAWVHLESKDADAANLYYRTAYAVQQAFPQLDLSEFSQAPSLALGGRVDIPRCRDRLLHLLGSLPISMILVFDGLENLERTASSLTLIESIVHGAPYGVRVFLLSREAPPFRLQRLKINREMALLNNEDLAFTAEEIDAFFKRRNGLTLPPEQIDRIRQITGGWAGALVLASESLDKMPESERAAWLDSHLPERLKREVLPYFSEEVFAAQPEKVCNLLMFSSLLEVVDPALLSELAQEPETDAIFRDLVRRNLFVHAIQDHQKGMLYRHNRLFRDFLQSLFQIRIPPKRQRALFERTADIYWAAGDLEKAVDFYLRAGQTERAVDGIMQTAMDLSVRGRFADLARWIDALPQERVAKDPWLLLYRGLASRIFGGKQSMEALVDVLDQFRSDSDVRGQMLSLAYLIESGVFLGADPTRLGGWIQEGEALLRAWSEKPFFAYAKSMLWLQIGFGHIAGSGDLQKGLSACQNAYILALRIGDSTLQINATIVSVLGMAVAGDFSAADRALERIPRIGSAAAGPEYRVLQAIVGIQLAMNRGDFDEAFRAVERSRSDIETFGLLFLYPAFVETAGRLALYRGDVPEAERSSRHLSDVVVLADNPFYRALSFRLAAMIRYFSGDFEVAAQLTASALSALPDTPGASIHRLRLKQLKGLISLHRNQTGAAESQFNEVLTLAAGGSSPLTLSETHLGLGLAYHAAGQSDRSEAHLRNGFSIAAERGYVHFLVTRPADVAKACLLFAGEDSPEEEYAARLLSSQLGSLRGIDMEAMLRDSRTDLGSHPVDVRRAVYRSGLPRIDIITLGGFSVLKDRRIPIAGRQWAGNRPKLLLKSIVVHGGRDIPKDILIEDLWPDSDAEAAAKNFKVTLHRLRKILEPELNRELGSAYLHLKDNHVSLDPALCRIDAEDFLALVKEVRKTADRGSPEELIGRCVQAVALYGGEFLPEEPYLPWAEMKRTLLRETYLELLLKMVDLYSARNRLERAVDCCKQMLQTDPTSDPACQRLMELYRRQGRRAAALKVYEAFKTYLISDIGVDPDPETTAMYRKLQHNP
jgi:ATP/maltotriose-dependent transcriptional regulator MalT/DNA-binding SARP family transcriptional activator